MFILLTIFCLCSLRFIKILLFAAQQKIEIRTNNNQNNLLKIKFTFFTCTFRIFVFMGYLWGLCEPLRDSNFYTVLNVKHLWLRTI